jgi:hypothetical protein
VAVGWQAVIVAVLAGFVGLAELISRYRSNPKYVLRHSLAAWTYIGINAVAGVVALFLIRALDWTFGQASHVTLWRILVAGFGAIAFFRTSLFVTKIGGSTVGVGPSVVLGSLLDACDREVDRKSAERLSGLIGRESKDLDPDKVMVALPVLCLALMQNFPSSDQALLGADLSNIRNDKTITREARMQAVVIHLARHLGEEVVKKVLANGKLLFAPSPPPAQEVIEQAKRLAVESQPPSNG